MRAFVKLARKGAVKVPRGQTGMTFVANRFTEYEAGNVAHISDYRVMRGGEPTIRDLNPEDFRVVVWF